MFLKHQVSILEWFLNDVALKTDVMSVTRDEVEDSNAEDRSFNNKVKQNKEQKPPRRGKTSRQAEDWSTVKHETLTRH